MRSGWAIRFYKKNDYENTLFTISSFDEFNQRAKDTLMVFSGLYGLDDYFVWFIHKDLPSYDVSDVMLDVKFYLMEDVSKQYWHEQYIPLEVKYEPNENRYELYGISESTSMLDTRLITYGVKSLTFEEERGPQGVLEEVLEGVLDVNFYYSESRPEKLYQYRQISLNRNWTVRNFIDYICDDNKLEWYIRDRVLFVGNELRAIEGFRSSADYDSEEDNISKGVFFKKLQSDPRPMMPLAHLGKAWKCIWAKHIVGPGGGMSKGCFTRIGHGGVPKEMYRKSLEGEIEQLQASSLQQHTESYSVRIGNILEDAGDTKLIDNISMQKDLTHPSIRYPNDYPINIGDGEVDVVNTKEQVCRASPYLDTNAGLLFPKADTDTDNPNSLIFNIHGREEMPVHHGFIPGNGRDLELPKKNPKDFRLQFPNGWCLYVDEEGNTLLQTDETDPESIPEEKDKPTITIKKNGRILLQQDQNNFIVMDSDGIMISTENDVDILANGEIDMDGSKTKLEGGGHKLSHADHVHGYKHIHTTGNMGIPIPDIQHIGTGTDTDPHISSQGTTNTEAD